MPTKPLTQEVIDKIKAAGFDVYMYEPGASWLIYTDGTQVAYLQDNRFGGLNISTKHHPNKHHGSGFIAVENLEVNDLTREILERGFMTMPHWADHRYPVRKYKDIEEFLASGYFSPRYRKV